MRAASTDLGWTVSGSSFLLFQRLCGNHRLRLHVPLLAHEAGLLRLGAAPKEQDALWQTDCA